MECLIRLLTVGPLSADMANMSFKPRRQHFFYEDFVDGERLKRVYAALQPGADALTSVLFFDSINRDKKGCYTYIYPNLLWKTFCLDLYQTHAISVDVCVDICFDLCLDLCLDLCFD